MLYFANDYMEGAHPLILQKLLETNLEKTPGYGQDRYCQMAKEKIRYACGCPEAEIFFLMGGTQTNAAIIRSLLRPWEGVLASEAGHISLHEAGAIEAGGHKVLTLPQKYGKIDAQTIREFVGRFRADENHAHMVYPGMVYISHPTEYGALYTKEELYELSLACRENGLPLFLDGARLGYALASNGTDVTLKDIAGYCDVFYIGGTKVGALFGEAVVFPRGGKGRNLFTLIKQQGALLAKGRLLGIQFDVLFTDGLYLKISRNAIDLAERLKAGFAEKGYVFYFASPTNQQFITLENKQLKQLSKEVSFSFWETADDCRTTVRFVTNWATEAEDVKKLLALI